MIRDKREQTLSLPVPEKKQSELLEESWEAPELDADVDVDLAEINIDIAKLQPALALAARNTGEAVERAMEAVRKGFDEQKLQMKKQGQMLSKRLEDFRRSSRHLEKLQIEFNAKRDMI